MSDILLKKQGHPINVDVVNVIKLFTGELIIRDGKFIKIKRIPKSDFRYNMLLKRPRIKQIMNETVYHLRDLNRIKGSAWFKLNGKFMVINSGFQYIRTGTLYYEGFVTEIFYKQSRTLYFIR